MNTSDGLLPTGCKGQRSAITAFAQTFTTWGIMSIIWDVPHKDGSYSCAENKAYHGLHAGSTSVNGGKGFRGGFLTWWTSRPLRLQGSPHELPFTIPSVSTAMAIFRGFQANFRKLEPRHQRHRHELLSAYFQEHQDKLFTMMKPEGKAQLQHSADERSSSILAIYEDQQNIHIADELVVLEHDTCEFRLKFVKWMAQLYIFRKRFCFNPQSPSL